MSNLQRVSVRARGDDAEPLRALLLDLVPAGIEEHQTDDGIELAVYVPLDRVAAIREALPDVAVSDVEEGWEDAWRAFHRPVEVAGLWVGPPWMTPPDPRRAVVIDPGRAFGTGAHPTTRLCIELLATTTERGVLLDVGCGSGVLGIAAVRLGFGHVVCVDVDPVAIEITRGNAAVNSVKLDIHVLDAEIEELPPADVAVANVLLEPVERILARLEAHEAVTSGYRPAERPAHPGWTHVETLVCDGWAADLFIRE